MKKAITLFAVLILVIGLASSVLAIGNLWPNWTGEAGHFTIRTNVEKSWNLVPSMNLESITDASEVSEEDIVVAYWYINDIGGYVEIYPNNNMQEELEKRGYNSLAWYNDNRFYLMNSAMWIYSTKAGLLEVKSYDSMYSLDTGYVKLKQAWNFIAITPDMVGQTLNEMKGDCTIEKSYAWNAEAQTWWELKDQPFPETVVGNGIVVKTSNDCQLGKEIISEVPALPE